MKNIFEYLGSDLTMLAILLYLLGGWFKKMSGFPDKYIPTVLLIIGVVLGMVYHLAIFDGDYMGFKEGMLCMYNGVTRGALAACASTFVNQIIKQANKEE